MGEDGVLIGVCGNGLRSEEIGSAAGTVIRQRDQFILDRKGGGGKLAGGNGVVGKRIACRRVDDGFRSKVSGALGHSRNYRGDGRAARIRVALARAFPTTEEER